MNCNKKYLNFCAGIIITMVIAIAFLSCDRSGEIPVTTWRTTGVHRIEVVFGDTTKWVGQCVFTAGYRTGSGLYEDGKQLNDSTEMYIEKSLRSYNVYSDETCDLMAVGISFYAKSPDAKLLTITIRGYVNDNLTNTAICEFQPETKVKSVEFRTEARYR